MRDHESVTENILIVKTSAIGDVTHTLPALYALRHQYPKARITWLVEEASADLISNHPLLDRVLVSRRKSWLRDLRSRHCLAAIREIVRFVHQVRDTRYDLLIDFQNLLKSGIFVGLARAERKAGFGRGMEHSEFSYLFLNKRVPAVDMNIHAARRELMLLETLGVDTATASYDLPVAPADRQNIDDMLASHSILGGDRVVAINPMATWETKLWSEDGFARVADELLQYGVKVVFTGSRDDRPAVAAIIRLMSGTGINLAGRTTLKTLAALFKRADLVISTDTGPMHIAAAVGTPVVALFGPTSALRTGPFGAGHQVLQADLHCVPCLRRRCATIECMAKISVQQVVTAVRKVL
jgi:heptosyltransferase-1